MNRSLKGLGIVCVFALSVSACTEPGETTGMGAAAGGVLGAGLGAIVGSATGDAGAGLVIGAVAGTAAGAAVGNMVEGQEATIRTQDEAIERHERIIQAQRGEIEELRRVHQDGPLASLRRAQPVQPRRPESSAFSAPTRVGGRAERVLPQPQLPHARTVNTVNTVKPYADLPKPSAAALATRQSMSERNLTQSESGSELQRRFAEQSAHSRQPLARKSQDTVSNLSKSAGFESPAIVEPAIVEPPASEIQALSSHSGESAAQGQTLGAVGALATETQPSADCTQAGAEAEKAGRSSELADKLFHLRRALRMCPENATYHNDLGEVYLALNRKTDAAFEFREAVRLDPKHEEAQTNLRGLQN